jgi:predicted dehydrogenase
MNLGKYQPDGEICDLAPHDISILLYLIDRPIVQVSASARSIFREHNPEVAFITLTFAGGVTANIQVSWLAPRKVREMVIVGSKRMVQYDDTAADESVRIFDRGMEFKEPSNFGEHQLSYRSGDIVVPRVEAAEPLSLELEDFARAIRTGLVPASHSQLGLETVAAIEGAETSLQLNGEPVVLEHTLERAAA